MHYDIHPPSKTMIAKLIADRPNMLGEDDSEIDDEDEIEYPLKAKKRVQESLIYRATYEYFLIYNKKVC